MTDTDDAELRALHTLRVRGLVASDGVAESSGLEPETAEAALRAAADAGYAKERNGRISGFSLTANGRERHQKLLQEATTPAITDAVSTAYDAFLAPNQHFKELTTAHQTQSADSGAAPDTVSALQEVDAEVTAMLEPLSAEVPRFAAYAPRLARARDAFVGGDASMLAAPMRGSYHDVWMELHEDLLVTLGRERTDDDG